MPEPAKKLSDIITIDPDTNWIEIDYDAMHFTNTHLTKPAANYFNEHGYYCPYAKEMFKDKWTAFWKEEQRRCREGYVTEDGLEITGKHYFYLNYCPIVLAKDVIEKDGSTTHRRQEDLPRFYDGDFLFFHLLDLARKMDRHMIVLKARRKGYSYKAQPNSQLIETPKGLKPMGSIKVGDKVIGANGNPINVLQIHPQGKKEVFKVTLRDGRSALCSKDHLWTVRDFKGNKRTLTTEKLSSVKLIKNKGKNNQYYHWFIENTAPVTYSEKEFGIHPYLLGAYLGDGNGTTDTLRFTSEDSQIIDRISSVLPEGHTINQKSRIQYSITTEVGKPNVLFENLRKINVAVDSLNKRIPIKYFYGSVEQRMDLLKGLMDTDGTCTKGASRFCTSSEGLKDDVCRLLAGLGIRYYVGKPIQPGKTFAKAPHWIVSITTDKDIFSLDRKLKQIRKDRQYNFNKIPIVSIESMGYREEQTCITVDSEDGLYLSENYLVTHNCGSLLLYNYYHNRNTKNYAFASEQKYLDEEGILSKTWDMLSFIDEHTAWYQARHKKDQNMHKRASMVVKEDGKEIEKGLKNDIIGVTLKDNPDKIRGKAGEIMLFEELGKFPGLLTAWQIAKPTVKQGSKTLGTMIGFGTGGTEDADFESAEELFYNPEPYDVLAFNNIWDEGAIGSECGFFVPNCLNLDGFIDEEGNSNMKAARKFEQKERQKMKKANSAKDYEQYVAEHAETPNEAVLQTEANLFPVIELNEQFNVVRAQKKHSILTAGHLINKSGHITFRPDPGAKPVLNYPHRKDDDLRGCILLKEAPYKTKDGTIPRGMYYVCHDPYAHDSSTNKQSLGAAYVIKRTNAYSLTYNECIVASYVGRPATQDEYNKNLFNLAEYYNAKIGFENDRGEVIAYAKRHKKLGLLQEEFEMLHKKELQSRAVNRPYGMHMTPQRKDQGEIYIRDWLNTVIRTDAEEGQIKVLHTIYDLALLKELIKYDSDGNFDRVMALMVGMYMSKELYNKEVRTGPLRDPMIDNWFDNHYNTNLNG